MKGAAAALVTAAFLVSACGGGEEGDSAGAPAWIPATAAGSIVTVLGGAEQPLAGLEGAPREIRLLLPVDVAFDSKGALYVAERYNHRIVKADPDGDVTVAAGRIDEETGWAEHGFAGDGGPATEALLNQASTIAVGPDDSLYIGDAGNSRIRKVDPDGVITTIAGTGEPGFSGDGGPAAQAQVNNPLDLLVDPAGNVYFVDAGNYRIRKIDPAGTITTVAGTGELGFSEDGTPARQALIGDPTDHMPIGLALDAEGNLLFTDMGNRRIRMIDAEGRVRTVAGNGEYDYVGDGFAPLHVAINDPLGIAVGRDGTIYIATHTHGVEGNLILAVGADGRVNRLAGGTTGYAGDGGAAAGSELDIPAGLAIGPEGNLYIADANNNVIRMIALS